MSPLSRLVLIVDDEASIVRLAAHTLQQEGFRTMAAENGQEALENCRAHKPDLILLDIMLPVLDGWEVCRTLRAEGSQTPIIMLTAREEEIDRILGLELGADDYITKPFSPREMAARVKAVLRRCRPAASQTETLSRGELEINREKYQVSRGNRVLNLSAREFELLYLLASRPGKVFSREELLNTVWGYDFAGETRLVDVHISRLREELGDNPREPRYIITVRGVGYKFKE